MLRTSWFFWKQAERGGKLKLKAGLDLGSLELKVDKKGDRLCFPSAPDLAGLAGECNTSGRTRIRTHSKRGETTATRHTRPYRTNNTQRRSHTQRAAATSLTRFWIPALRSLQSHGAIPPATHPGRASSCATYPNGGGRGPDLL